MKINAVFGVCVLSILVCCGTGCAPERPSDVESNLTRRQDEGDRVEGEGALSGQPVAIINHEIVTLGEFERRLSTLAEFAQARFSTVESKQEYLVDVVQFEVLADEAERRGYGKDALVLQAMKDVLAHEVLEQELRNRVSVGEADDESATESTKLDEITDPSTLEDRRLIVLSTDSEKEASVLRAQMEDEVFDSVADRVQSFRILAHRYSTERLSADRGGDVGFVSVGDLSREALSEQAFLLREIGDISSPYKVEDGWQLAMLFETRAIQTSSLSEEDVRAKTRRELFERRRDAAGAEFVDSLMRLADVKVFSERVAELPLSPRRGMSTGVDSIRTNQE